MDLFHKIYDVQGLVQVGGLALIAAIIFAETGLLVGFFLPGDSLLVTAGIFAPARTRQAPLLNIVCAQPRRHRRRRSSATPSATGSAPRPDRSIFTREKSLFFSKKHLLRTQEFYERHGGKTIIIARFMPIIRTFAPGRRRRRQDELPPVPPLQRLRRHRLGAQHDAARVHAGQGLPADHQADRQGHHRHHRGVADAGRDQLPAQSSEEVAAVHHRSPCDDGRRRKAPKSRKARKPRSPKKPRARAAKVAFPKKGQPPTHAEFAARLPAPVGKRFEVLRSS